MIAFSIKSLLRMCFFVFYALSDSSYICFRHSVFGSKRLFSKQFICTLNNYAPHSHLTFDSFFFSALDPQKGGDH